MDQQPQTRLMSARKDRIIRYHTPTTLPLGLMKRVTEDDIEEIRLPRQEDLLLRTYFAFSLTRESKAKKEIAVDIRNLQSIGEGPCQLEGSVDSSFASIYEPPSIRDISVLSAWPARVFEDATPLTQLGRLLCARCPDTFQGSARDRSTNTAE